MKKRIFKVMATTGFFILLVSGAYAQMETHIIANIPFAFIAGTKTFPAGEYTIDRPSINEPGLILIRGVDNKQALFLNVENVQARKTPEKTELVFNEIGDKYFLSKIWVTGEDSGREIPKPRPDRELERVALAQQVSLQPSGN